MKQILLASLLFVFTIISIAIAFSVRPIIIYHDEICIKPHSGYHYLTCNNITVTIDHFILVIPKNFDTDLASIPRFIWSLMAPSRSEFIAPSILHDYLYTCHNGFARKEIDEIYYYALVKQGVSKFWAYEMYVAVRLFGNGHFSQSGSCEKRLARNFKNYKREIHIS